MFSAATAYSNAYFGQGNGSVVLDDVACVGNESRLVDCQYTANNNCTHTEDAGISCKAECKCMHDYIIYYGNVEHWWGLVGGGGEGGMREY